MAETAPGRAAADEVAFLHRVYGSEWPRLGPFHRRRVRDRVTGEEGTLRDVMVWWNGEKRERTEIFIRPPGGGYEWPTAPENVEFLRETT
ncbi:hypothetical protein [Streptomyces sp. NBC_01803]|uniref:hypothetical protein n=1 Tax=Streptomyces sp. NBC_01803 TaxID=2975946 RepID=UPI002DD8567D|nr:hypothetical protein [Streptomyces sp. NBC_01803]WSA44615.1 hypothetical protein OIE51_10600 [Streptomyces sp. NBC_01803]